MITIYQPGDIAAYNDDDDQTVLIIGEIIGDVYLGAAIAPAESPVIPGSATGLYYVESIDGYIVPTLVRAYRADELGTRSTNIASSRPFDLARSLYRGMLGSSR